MYTLLWLFFGELTKKNSYIATTPWNSQRWLENCAKSRYRQILIGKMFFYLIQIRIFVCYFLCIQCAWCAEREKGTLFLGWIKFRSAGIWRKTTCVLYLTIWINCSARRRHRFLMESNWIASCWRFFKHSTLMCEMKTIEKARHRPFSLLLRNSQFRRSGFGFLVRSRCLRGIQYIHAFMYSTRLLFLWHFFLCLWNMSQRVSRRYVLLCGIYVRFGSCRVFCYCWCASFVFTFEVNQTERRTFYECSKKTTRIITIHLNCTTGATQREFTDSLQQITFSRNYFRFYFIAFSLLNTCTHTLVRLKSLEYFDRCISFLSHSIYAPGKAEKPQSIGNYQRFFKLKGIKAQ